MKHYMAGIVFLVFLLLAQLVSGADQKVQKLTEELLVKSGIAKQVEQIPSMVEVGFTQGHQQAIAEGEALSDETFNKMKQVISGSFEPELIKQYFVRRINAKLDLDDIQAVLKWLNSPLGKKITHLEESSSTPEAYEEMMLIAGKLEKSQSSPQRLGLLRRIDTGANMTENSVDMAINMHIAVASATLSAFPSPGQPSINDIRTNVEMNRAQIRGQVSAQVFANLLYTYRDLSESELENYASFIESKPGARYHYVTISALNAAMLECSRRCGSAMKSFVTGDPWEKITEDIARPLNINRGGVYPQKK